MYVGFLKKLRKGIIFFIRALLLLSFSFYLEVFQIIMGNKQLLFFKISYDLGE